MTWTITVVPALMWRATASGGKSGTAEQLDWKDAYKYRPDGDYRKAISFAAILPADDPEILVLVMMDDPRWIFDYASQIVAPVTGNIISQIAPYLGIERDASYDSNGSVEVPNAIGTRWTSAQVKMNAAGLFPPVCGYQRRRCCVSVPRRRHRGARRLHGLPVYPVHHRRHHHRAGCHRQNRNLCRTDAQGFRRQCGNFGQCIGPCCQPGSLRLGVWCPTAQSLSLTTEPDGSSDAQQDADTSQDDAAQDGTPQDAAGENDQDSTTQDDTGSDAEQQ